MSKDSANKPLKVVQWATGNIGMRSLRTVIEHPAMTLAGLYVHSESKVGKDAGELCGLDPVGIKATNSLDEIIATGADCVLYMQQGCNVDDICRLLEAGINIVTTRVEFLNPRVIDPTMRERVEDACQRGGSSIHSTGSSPGFITEAMPVVLTSLQRRLDCMTIDEFADLRSRNSPELLFDIMGFGKPPVNFGEERLDHVKAGFSQSLHLIADALSLPLDSVEAKGELATVPEDVRIEAGVIEKGTVGAQRITLSGMRNGHPLLQMRLNWYCTTNIDASWDLRETGWRVLVKGDVPLDVSITLPVAEEDYAATTPGLTAHRAVNAVAVVCAAAPGIRTTVELPQIIADLSE